MDKVLVLCISEIRKRQGSGTLRIEDSVMVEAEFEDQVHEQFNEHYKRLQSRDPWLVGWRMVSYLPQRPLKRGTRYLH